MRCNTARCCAIVDMKHCLLLATEPSVLRGDAMPVVRPPPVRYAHRHVAGGASGHAAAAAGGGRGTCVYGQKVRRCQRGCVWPHDCYLTKGHVSTPDTCLAEDAPFRTNVQNSMLAHIEDVEPLWEDAAASMGLPRNLEGVARLIRAAAAEVRTHYLCTFSLSPSLTKFPCRCPLPQMDPHVVELSFFGMAMLPAAPQLVACQQALCEL